MSIDEIRYEIVKKGICLYAGVAKYFVYICEAHIQYGTGDYDDPPVIAEDLNIQCFTVYYSSLLGRNIINAFAG